MATPSDETIAALEKQNVQNRLTELEKQFAAQKTLVDSLKEERDKQLKWGIIALGTAVIGMATWVVNLFTAGHIK